MKLTTTDARLRLCPQTLVNDTFETCEGQRCMAWRWAHVPMNRYVVCVNREAKREPVRPSSVPSAWVWMSYDNEGGDIRWAQWMEPDEDVMDRALGYCGLAGVPHA